MARLSRSCLSFPERTGLLDPQLGWLPRGFRSQAEAPFFLLAGLIPSSPAVLQVNETKTKNRTKSKGKRNAFRQALHFRE
jgi:hypothetical protein